jgi:hypothetical protein
MKLKPYLRNAAKRALNVAILSLILSGCTSSTNPTYFKENIDYAIKDIAKKEYNIDVVSRIVGNTLWVYMPLEDIFEKADKPEKYKEMFLINGVLSKDQLQELGLNWDSFSGEMVKNNWADYETPLTIRIKGDLETQKESMTAVFGKEFLEKVWPFLRQSYDDDVKFNRGELKTKYRIETIPEREKLQEYVYNKKAIEKINNLWKVIRRVLFSMDRSKRSEPRFFCIVSGDIKNGFAIKEIFYYLDIKKVSYEYISWTEYQHRTIEDIEISLKIIGDREGNFINYKNITLEEFLAGQIQHRIKLKFQKAEVSKNADIDKEIIKIAVTTLKAYDFKDFSNIELNNLATNNKIILNQAAVWARAANEQPKF